MIISNLHPRSKVVIKNYSTLMTDLDDTVVHVHGPDPLTETLTGRRHVPDQIGLKVWVTHVLVPDLFHHRHWDIVLVILLQGI